MSLRTNLIVGAVFLALLAFVYFYEIRGGEQRRIEVERAKELLSFTESAAKRIVLERGDTVVVLHKESDEWRLSEPVEDVADQQAVERLLQNLRETERERVVADSAAVAQDARLGRQYGLDTPRLRLLLELDEGPLDTLVFGASTPTDRYTYVQQRGPNRQIFVVRAWRYDNLDKGAFDLRDQRVLPFEPAQVQAIRLDRPEETVGLERGAASSWRLVAPLQARADQDAVRSLLNRLEYARVHSFVTESAAEAQLDAYGLAPVRTLELSLLTGAERAEKRLRVGARTPAGGYYARDMSAPQIFEVDSSLVRDLDKPLEQLRDKRVLDLASDEVTRIELARPGAETIVATRDTAGVWSVLSPSRLPARSWGVGGLLQDLENLEAEGFAREDDPAVAGAPDLLAISLSGDEGELANVRFAGAAEETVYALCEGEPAVYRLARGDFGTVDLRLEDLAELESSPAAEPAGAPDGEESAASDSR